MTAPSLATVTTSPVNVTAYSAATDLDDGTNTNSQKHESLPPENVEELPPSAPETRITRPGMDRGYALSPMAHLWLEFGKSTERTISTSARCLSLATKATLKPDEVIDQGPEFEFSGRFRIQDKLSRNVYQTVEELQTFIRQMASLVPERSHYFIVDPDDTLLEVLEGAESTGQLLAAWKALSNRIESAQKFMLKYRDEYTEGMAVASPTSTNQELLREHSDQIGNDDRLRFMYGEFPRHNERLSTSELAKLREGRQWNEIIRVPAWLEAQSRLKSPPLPSLPTTNPSQLQASSNMGLTPRSSYKSGAFTLPPLPEESKYPSTPSKHVSWMDQPMTGGQSFSPWQGASTAPPRNSSFSSTSTPFSSTEQRTNFLLGVAAPPTKNTSSTFGRGIKTVFIPCAVLPF
jgi:hypothetical protein